MNRKKNVNFVQLVENHVCPHDITSSSYTRKDIKEKVWNDISKITHEIYMNVTSVSSSDENN